VWLAALLLAAGGLTAGVSLWAEWAVIEGAYFNRAVGGSELATVSDDAWSLFAWQDVVLAVAAAALLALAAVAARGRAVPWPAPTVVAALSAAAAVVVLRDGLDAVIVAATGDTVVASSGGGYVALVGLGLGLLGLWRLQAGAGAAALVAGAGALTLLATPLMDWGTEVGWTSYTPLSSTAFDTDGPDLLGRLVPDLPAVPAIALALAVVAVLARPTASRLLPALVLAACAGAFAVTLAVRVDQSAPRRVYEYSDGAGWATGPAPVVALVGLALAVAGLAVLMAGSRAPAGTRVA
jgi:hypothetical protein